MKSKVLSHALAAISLSASLFGLGCIEVSQIVNGSTQGKRGPTVDLPKARNTSAGVGIANRSLIVSMPAEGEFYVAGGRLSEEALAETIRGAFVDRPPDEIKTYVRCGALLKFGAVRQLLNVIREDGFNTVEFVVESADSQGNAVIEAQIFTPPGSKVDPSDLITGPAPRRETLRNPAPLAPAPTRPLPPPTKTPLTKAAPEPLLGALALVVEVRTDGSAADPVVALNRTAMPLPELRSTLSSLLERRPNERLVFVKPSRDITYADFIAVMDEIKDAGADYVWLLIDDFEVPRGVPGGLPGRVPDETPKTIRKSASVLQRSATRRVEPATPPLARAARVTGAVVVEVTIDEHGDVIAANTLSGHPLLKDAAVKAARGWKFAPAQLRGEPVQVIGPLTFTFKE